MLTGQKSVAEIERFAPEMSGLSAQPVPLEAEILNITYEMAAAGSAGVLPPALHPTIPPLVTWTVWRVTTGELGPFAMAQTRVACRSGARPRAYLVSALVDGPRALEALASRWGFRCAAGEVTLERSYDRLIATARLDGREVLAAEASDPVPLHPNDVQWIANMNLARTPRGVRLVQVDADYEVTRAERAIPKLRTFDAGAWGEDAIVPRHPVAASFTTATVTLPRIRFLCKPDALAFVGTEVVG